MAINWAMSAALENVVRGSQTLPEVTSLAEAVREWLRLEEGMKAQAELTPEQPIQLADEGPTMIFRGDQISELAKQLGE